MIGIHAERVAADARAVRWVVPAGTLPAGRVRRAPGRFGEMLCEGMFSDALTEHTAVWLWLRDDLSWSGQGGSVGAALREALAEPGGWEIDPAPGEVLERVTADLLAGSVGDFIRSHGGSVVAQRDGHDVWVRLGGACQHCPAAERTLASRLLEALRDRCPGVVEAERGPGCLRVHLPRC